MAVATTAIPPIRLAGRYCSNRPEPNTQNMCKGVLNTPHNHYLKFLIGWGKIHIVLGVLNTPLRLICGLGKFNKVVCN